MNILIIGVTGLLGCEAANQLVAKGHKIKGLALPSIPDGINLSSEVELVFGNYITDDDSFIKELFTDMDAFIFASGIDERIEVPFPAFEIFNKYNVYPLKRIFKFAKETGVKHCVILGSYFTYFVTERPELELEKHHPYIKSRELQKNFVLNEASTQFSVALLELPYIFGVQKGRKPVWTFLVEMLQNMKVATFFPKGGTAMVTVKQVGQAICGALEKTQGGKAYPIGYYNLTWKELLKTFHVAMGVPKKPIFSISKFLFKMYVKKIKLQQDSKKIEGGLNLVKFADMQYSKQFIDPFLASIFLGVTDDDIYFAIKESVLQSLEMLNNKDSAVDMKL
ncbi:MAG: NAD(P)-dependent oxidoreductase [Bacilli bacterium]